MISRKIILSLALTGICTSGCYEEEASAPTAHIPTELISDVKDDTPAISKPIEVTFDDYGRPLSHALLGQKAPEFNTEYSNGTPFSQNDLMGKWTVLNFWGLYCHDSLHDAKYANALKTAIEQDPDLNFVSFHTAPKEQVLSKPFGKYGSLSKFFKDKQFKEYPVALDLEAEIRKKFAVEWTPTYLLIGPDLTIEFFRSDLSTDEEGVKQFIQDIQKSKLKASQRTSIPSQSQFAANSAPAATISSAGVAGLAGQTPFDMWAIKQAFDGYDVRSVIQENEDGNSKSYEVYDGGDLVMLISPDETGDWVGSATAINPIFKGPFGETIGRSRLSDVSQEILGNCIPASGLFENMLSCQTDTDARFARLYSLPTNYAETVSELPEDVRKNALLAGLRFIPSNRAF